MIAFFIKYLPIPLCSALAVFFTYFPITDTDIFWHLAAGREIAARKGFLFTDPFSFTLASPQWIDLHWLFQLIVYGLYQLGGLWAIIIFKLAVVAFVCTVLCLVFRKTRYISISAFCCAIFFFHARYLVLDRPVLITMACMAFYIFLFENVRQGLGAQWLLLCIPLQMIWTNSQGLYPIGIFMIGAYWFEKMFQAGSQAPQNSMALNTSENPSPFSSPTRRFFTIVFFLCIVSCLVNPYGFSGLLLPFRLFGRITPDVKNIYSLTISENVPLMSLTGFEAGYRTLVIVSAMVTIALFIMNGKRTRVAHVALFTGFLALAFSAVRNVLLYCIVIIPIIASAAMNADVLFRLGKKSPLTRRFLGVGVIIVGIACLWIPIVEHWAVVRSYPPHRALSPFRFPEKITEYLKANPVQGEMFNDIRYGGYLMWNFFPQKKVFIDGRLVIRSPRFFAEYLAICDQPELFPQVVSKFDITYAILPYAIFDRYRKLIKWLYDSKDWHLEFTDGASFLFVRNDARQARAGGAVKFSALVLSDSATVMAVADSIRAEWKDAPGVRKEALGYFSESLKYLASAPSAEVAKP